MKIYDLWISLFYNSATGKGIKRLLLSVFGGVLFIGWLALFIAGAFWLDNCLAIPGFIPFPGNYIVGVPLVIVGLYLTFWTTFLFLKARGLPLWSSPPPCLVRNGPYAIMRNPMLSGIFLAMFGLGALVSSTSLFFVLTPLFILLYFIELKKVEEPELEKRLGEEYTRYKKEVPMFFPRLKPAKTHQEVREEYEYITDND